MDEKDLLPFCSKDETRRGITQPWSQGPYTYATNGVILIRIPRIEYVPENPLAPHDVDRMFVGRMNPAVMYRVDEISLPLVDAATVCSECGGSGCEDCDWTGKEELFVPVKLGSTYFNARQLLLLKALPECVLGVHKDAGDSSSLLPAYFRFAYGDGLLIWMMPPIE